MILFNEKQFFYLILLINTVNYNNSLSKLLFIKILIKKIKKRC